MLRDNSEVRQNCKCDGYSSLEDKTARAYGEKEGDFEVEKADGAPVETRDSVAI